MRSGEAPVVTTEPGATSFADACRGVRERLEAIAQALGELREDLDRALRDVPTPPPADDHPED